MYLNPIGLGKKAVPKKRNAPVVKVKLVSKNVAKSKVVARRPIATVAKSKAVPKKRNAPVVKVKLVSKNVAKPKVAPRRPIANVRKPKVVAIRPIANKGFSSTIYPASNNKIESYPGESISNEDQKIVEEPVGVLTPVKQAAVSIVQENVTQTGNEDEIKTVPDQYTDPILPLGAAPKSNTIMYVGGAVVLGAIAYLATKKK